MTERKTLKRLLPIPNYEEQYAVTGDGQVIALERLDCRGIKRKQRVLRPLVSVAGRRYVTLCQDGVPKQFDVSYLHAIAYGMTPPSPVHVIQHKNGDRSDFNRENLAWILPAERLISDGRKRHTKFTGVFRTPSKAARFPWRCVVTVAKKRVYEELFATELEAAIAYNKALDRLGLARRRNDVSGYKARAEKPDRSLPGERWKPLPAFPDDYQISSMGRVRSMPRRTAAGHRVGGIIRKNQVQSAGTHTLLVKDQRLNVGVQMLIAFRGVKNISGWDVRYRNGDRSVLRLSNLIIQRSR